MEIMISLSILAVISTLIWAAFAQTGRNREVIEKSMDRYHQAAVAFERIAADLSTAHLSRNRSSEKTNLMSEPGFIGRNESPDRFDFTSFSHTRRFTDAKEGDRCEVGYRVEEDKEKPGIYNLVRREATTVDDDPFKGGRSSVLVEDVTGFDVEYYDQTMDKWEKEWDTTQLTGQQGRLPMQVRVTLEIRDEKGRPVKLATQLALDVPIPIMYQGGEI